MMTLVSAVGLAMALSTFPLVRWITERRASRAAEIVVSVLDRAGRMARCEGNEFVVFFDADGRTMWILDDDGGGTYEGPRDPAAGRGNGRQDPGERVLGPYMLPPGQLLASSAAPDPRTGATASVPLTFPGDPPKVVFYPDGTASENGTICVVSEYSRGRRGGSAGRIMTLQSSTGSVSLLDDD